MRPAILRMLSTIDITSFQGKIDYLLLLFGHHTGLRLNDLERLRVGHVFEFGNVSHLSSLPGECRTFLLNPTARKCVLKLLELYRARSWPTGSRSPLFQNARGMGISASLMRDRLERLQVRAGLQTRLDLQVLKQSLANHLFCSGVAFEDLDERFHSALLTESPDLEAAYRGALRELGLKEDRPFFLDVA